VTGMLLKLARWPILLLLVGSALTLIYRYGPSRIEPRWRWITRGSACAAVAWLAASALFSWYAANFGSFNKTYGSLGAVIGFMTWIWLSTIVVLVGGKLNAEIEHHRRLPKLRRPAWTREC
jgi:membrane protein